MTLSHKHLSAPIQLRKLELVGKLHCNWGQLGTRSITLFFAHPVAADGSSKVGQFPFLALIKTGTQRPVPVVAWLLAPLSWTARPPSCSSGIGLLRRT